MPSILCRARRVVILAWITCLALSVTPPLAVPGNPDESPEERNARMRWWREARFGMFIHWGIYAVPARGEWVMYNEKIPIPTYEGFADRFNPTAYDPLEWVRLAKEAGMKYIIITSKHHDGFCLWDSRVSTYDIIDRTSYRRDILRQLARSCAEEGIRLGWYHSIMDWHHPSASGSSFPQYREEYLKPQLRELLTGYGPIAVLWFDGEWIAEWTEEQGKDLYNYVRSLQPAIIINNRVGKGRSGMAGLSTDPSSAGDFGTPEQEIPPQGIEGMDWESCMTMNDHWGYAENDQNWKSARQLVFNLIDIAAKGGNYLLNVGPKADGTFPPESIRLLKTIGSWMQVHADAIHGTQASPFPSTPWGRCTQRIMSNGAIRLYLHIFDWPEGGTLKIPGIGTAPLGAAMMEDPRTAVFARMKRDTLIVQLPQESPDSLAAVVFLNFGEEPLIFHPPIIRAAADLFLDSLTVEMYLRPGHGTIYYTVDGTDPAPSSPEYTGPLTLTASTVLRARAFWRNLPVGSEISRSFSRVAPILPASVTAGEPGIRYSYYEGTWDSLPGFSALTPVRQGISQILDMAERQRDEFFGLVYEGFLVVPDDGVYYLALSSDDGSKLYLHDSLVIANDGLHSELEKATSVPLGRGLHPIRIEYFNKSGGRALRMSVGLAGEHPHLITEAELRH